MMVWIAGQDVAVLAETELMAAMLMSKRKFTLIHGGVVRSPDLLGERKGELKVGFYIKIHADQTNVVYSLFTILLHKHCCRYIDL